MSELIPLKAQEAFSLGSMDADSLRRPLSFDTYEILCRHAGRQMTYDAYREYERGFRLRKNDLASQRLLDDIRNANG